jgi:hemerythrin-like domain-containing protein
VKRSEELAPLSRDHHHGLFAALQLTRATADGAVEAVAAFRAFWEAEGRRHFAIEEDLLLPGFARRVPPDHEAIVRVLVEHVDLRRRAQEPRELAEVHELGERLRAHIRYEEDVLFPLIERTLDSAELQALGAAIARAEGGWLPVSVPARGCR